ncbi:hypothetical protein JHK86_025581 [Glycine max]|nr:hypothetical protein JHK86_025581 [Glycine max]
MTYPRNIHQFKDPSSLVEATPQPTSSPPSPRDGSIKVLAFPENRADDIQAEARALARAANATSYTPQLVASKYGSQPIKVLDFCELVLLVSPKFKFESRHSVSSSVSPKFKCINFVN